LHKASDISGDNRRLGDFGARLTRIAGVVGAVVLGVSALASSFTGGGMTRFLHSYLVNYVFFVSLAIGALFFVMLQHVTRSGWSVVVRRLAEGVTTTMPLMAVLSLPLLFGIEHIYEWASADKSAADQLLQLKRPYLNVTFFVLRVVIYFVVWIGLARYFVKSSVRQDSTGDVASTLRMQRVSAPAIIAFALTVTFFSFDFLMSLAPYWYSTIFGVYFFSGAFVGFLGFLVLSSFVVQRFGLLSNAITAEHFHDMGKLVFAFVVFWAYIAFSQYMLIWYANIPEETGWFLVRQSSGWGWVSLALLFGHFLVPFVALISRYPKRRKHILVLGAVWVLLMHWIDIYWLVMPSVSPNRVPVHLLDLTCFAGVGMLFVAAAAHGLRNCSLIPERDPRLSESLAFENV